MRKHLILSFCGIITISFLSGCITPPHDTLVVECGELTSLDNRQYRFNTIYNAQVAYQYQGYLGMIAPGEAIITMPGVAERWEVNDNRTRWTFYLREGLTFHDGSPITAKAIRYSFYTGFVLNHYYELNNLSEGILYLTNYYGMNITFPEADPNGEGLIVMFHGNWFPDPMFEWDICGQWPGYMLVPYNSHGAFSDSNETFLTLHDQFQKNPISCGPYKYSNRSSEDYVLFERFDDWFGWGKTFTASNGKTYTFPTISNAFRNIKFRFGIDSAMLGVELLTRGVDLTTNRLTSLYAVEKLNNTAGFTAIQLPVLAYAAMQCNIQGDWPAVFGGPGNYPLSEPWFRQAVSHAVNRTNLVENVYLGLADEQRTIFPDWILETFNNIDVSNYYNFDQGLNTAREILRINNMTALGFEDEPDNILGWGDYANETERNSELQTKGRHLILTTMDCHFCIHRALAIQKDLKQIGIYIDTELLEWGTYITKYYEGVPGLEYSQTGPQPDPNFFGPNWDFAIQGYGGIGYETPWEFISYISFSSWMFSGHGGVSWLNMNYQKGYQMATGGVMSSLLSIFPDYDSTDWPIPDWSNDDPQFIAGCELAGYEISYGMNRIPLVWYVDTYAYNDHLKNFVGSRNSMWMLAYSYWE